MSNEQPKIVVSGEIFMEIFQDNSLRIYSELSRTKPLHKDFMSATLYFMRHNFIPVNFWQSVVYLENAYKSLTN